MKFVSVYLFKDRIIAAASSRATTGVWIQTGDYEQLPSNCPDAEIGALVIRQSAHCQIGIPPPDRRTLSKGNWRLPKFAGARSAAAFERGASLIRVTWEGRNMTLQPRRQQGTGWEELQGSERVIPSDIAPEHLGARVRECLRGAADADASPEDHARRPAQSTRNLGSQRGTRP